MLNFANILYEDNHLIIVNKYPSEIVQGDKTGDEPMSEKIKKYIKEKYNKPGEVFLGVAHRIDRPTSGAVIFARTGKALERINEMFRNKEIKKTYWAVVKNKPAKTQDTLVHYIVKDEAKNKSKAYTNEIKGSQKAIMEYRIASSSDRYHLLEIQLHTGRHHQIRAQLCAIGCSIKGDLKYGSERSNKDGSIHLHARSISFIHPVKKESLTITAPVPEDTLWKAFEEDMKNNAGVV
jgi:23S rRNA pseudouridine1911/1915/1917 synthase